VLGCRLDRRLAKGDLMRSNDHLPWAGALMFGVNDGQNGIDRNLQFVVCVNDEVVK
jgi:hypothetical protein